MVAFGGDKYLKAEFKKLIKKHNIKTIIETGTYQADTTVEFAKMVENVITIEYKKEFYEASKKKLKPFKNVRIIQGSSPQAIRKALPKAKKPVLFFLDAHWYRYLPLRDELQAIADCKVKDSVIVIHDFYVPGRKDLGYDQYLPNRNIIEYLWKGCWNKLTETLFKFTLYKRQRLEYPYIEDRVLAINKRYKHYYNKKANGGKRGVVFIHP